MLQLKLLICSPRRPRQGTFLRCFAFLRLDLDTTATTTITMAEKATPDIGYASHDEKNLTNPPPDYVDATEPTGRRRSSVALNIVENPLKVCLAELRHVQSR